jgi:hypothetical protein
VPRLSKIRDDFLTSCMATLCAIVCTYSGGGGAGSPIPPVSLPLVSVWSLRVRGLASELDSLVRQLHLVGCVAEGRGLWQIYVNMLVILFAILLAQALDISRSVVAATRKVGGGGS